MKHMQGRDRSRYEDPVRRGKVIQARGEGENQKTGGNLSDLWTSCPVGQAFFRQSGIEGGSVRR